MVTTPRITAAEQDRQTADYRERPGQSYANDGNLGCFLDDGRTGCETNVNTETGICSIGEEDLHQLSRDHASSPILRCVT